MAKSHLEKTFFIAICIKDSNTTVRDVIGKFVNVGFGEKQFIYYLKKWASLKIYDWKYTLDMGKIVYDNLSGEYEQWLSEAVKYNIARNRSAIVPDTDPSFRKDAEEVYKKIQAAKSSDARLLDIKINMVPVGNLTQADLVKIINKYAEDMAGNITRELLNLNTYGTSLKDFVAKTPAPAAKLNPYSNLYGVTVVPYLSCDHKGVPLISRVAGCITCEDYTKWYDLQYIDGDGKVYNLSDKFDVDYGRDIKYLDDSFYPPDVLKFAKKNNIRVGYMSYYAMCVMWAWNFYDEEKGFVMDKSNSLNVEDMNIYDETLVVDGGEINNPEFLHMIKVFGRSKEAMTTIRPTNINIVKMCNPPV